jgi:phage-related protein
LTGVVKYNNILPNAEEQAPDKLDQGRPQRFKKLPGGGANPVSRGADHSRRTTHTGHPQAPDGVGSGVMELALKHRGDAFRVVYALQIDTDIWVIHAFQKKSKSGIKTPKQETDLVHDRLRRLKERLQ